MNRFFRRMSLPQKTILGLAVALFPGLALPQATPDFEIAQRPITAGVVVAPNLVYIHDDSSSMSWTFMPDASTGSHGSIITVNTSLTFGNSQASHNMYSSTWNTVFYDPQMIYQPPLMWRDHKIVRMPNSDTLSTFPQVRRNGYPTRSYSSTTLAQNQTTAALAALNIGNTTNDTLNVGIQSVQDTFTSGNIGSGTLEPDNQLRSAIYYAYVPGFHSMRDNPDFDPATLESDQRNYEHWAFRQATAGAFFRTNNSNATLLNRTADPNRRIVVSRACPQVFSDVPESREYYGHAHGTCRVTYRSEGVTSTTGAVSNFTASLPSTNSYHGRPWCIRSNGFNYRTDGNNNFGCASTSVGQATSMTGAVSCSSHGSMTPLAWQPYGNDAAATTTGTSSNVPLHLTCHAGRHVIGDSTGKGYYNSAVDLDDNYVSYFEYSGQITGATSATGSPVTDAAANCNAATGNPGVCRNLYGPEQSPLYLVTHYIGDDGELIELDQPTRRTVRQEIRNFMNWYSYYRNRNMAAKVGMAEAFAFLVDREDTTKPSAAMNNLVIRLGYDTINSSSMGQVALANADTGNEQTMTNTFVNFRPGTNPSTRMGPHLSNRGGIGVVPFLDFPAGAQNPDGTPSPYSEQQFVKRFYDWVLGMPAPANTQLTTSMIAAGEYYRTDRPWMDYPPVRTTDAGSGNANTSTCRRSFTILMTDGYNSQQNRSGCTSGAVGAHSCTPGAEVQWRDGTVRPTYTPRAPFNTNMSGTLGDWALYYWKTDLRPGMTDEIVPTSRHPIYRKNEAFWQHMQTFTLGFGVQGTLSATELKSHLANPNVWDPDTGAWSGSPIAWNFTTTGQPNKVDELFHAGIAGRGDFFDTTNAREFADALREMLMSMTGEGGGSKNFAGSGGQGAEEWYVNVTTNYEPENWTGEVYAHGVCSPPFIGWELVEGPGSTSRCSSKLYGAPLKQPVWSASERLNDQYFYLNNSSWNARKVYTWGNDSGESFHQSHIPASSLGTNPFNNVNQHQKAVYDYLLGDRQNEVRRGGMFRDRDSLLADIINPMPYLLGYYQHNDYGYGSLECDSGGNLIQLPAGIVSDRTAACEPEEATFLTAAEINSYRQRVIGFRDNGRQAVVFAAANGGMLHAFVGGLEPTGNGLQPGEELFAYVPASLRSQLVRLTEPGYAHQYYVDGAPWVGDILLNGNWTSVLVGSTGRGKTSDDRIQRGSFFALNVENPENFNQGHVLWEFTHDDLGAPVDIDPVIVAVPQGGNNRNFAAVFGNGYNSANGRAGLFVVPLDQGGHNRALFYPVPENGLPNGLGSPYLLDLTSNGMMDLAYAGDAQGNMWKFDLRTGGVELLLAARDDRGVPQPIVAPPSVVCVEHARAGNRTDCLDGYQLVAGTGKYFEDTDFTSPQTQSIYGVRLNRAGGAINPTGGVATGYVAHRDNMQVRVYDGNHPRDDDFYRETTTDLTFTAQAWKLDQGTDIDKNPDVDYPNQTGYVIDLTGTQSNPMGIALMRAQGTVLVPRTRDFLMPITLPSSETCTGDQGGGFAEFNYEQGTWIRSSMFRRIEHGSNIWIHQGAAGSEVNRDSKYVLGTVMEVRPDGSRGLVFNTVGGARYGSGRHERQQVVNIPDPHQIFTPTRAGRQSWRQIR
ncbi:MAG: PilC/PilY family type IV pilus protein [Betaproteobacteria bacterium]|nr:PilC/PilY family type IV pilus protein [Betaproteobacteria bacterium]